jgi:FkbM family methyltransferase
MKRNFNKSYYNIKEKLSSYSRELAFGFIASSTWMDEVVLLRHTARFHLQNWLGGAHDDCTTFTVKLKIGQENLTSLTLRPFSGDLFVLYEVLANNVYHIAPRLLPPLEVATIVDCGANIGITSLFLAERYPQARVFSIEPHPENFMLLKKNVAQVPRIVPIRACVTGRSVGTVRFTTDQAAWGNHIAKDDDGVLVPAITIDELCEQNRIANINLLKLDIEGGEEHLFENGGFLNRTDHMIIELHGDYGFTRFQRDIAPYGFVAREALPPETCMITAFRTEIAKQ